MKDIATEWTFRTSRTREKAWMWIAWKLPKTLVMWASVRMIAHATGDKYWTTIVPELSAMDALKRWNEKVEK